MTTISCFHRNKPKIESIKHQFPFLRSTKNLRQYNFQILPKNIYIFSLEYPHDPDEETRKICCFIHAKPSNTITAQLVIHARLKNGLTATMVLVFYERKG